MFIIIGGHAVAFSSAGNFYFFPSFPTGLEFVFVDAFARGKSLTAGGFVYPDPTNKYYNLWLRWGGSWFFELNYFAWNTQSESISFRASSWGLSIGFPLAKF
jgi:hypothetical protein